MRLDDGREVVAHTNNTGRMTRLPGPGRPGVAEPGGQPARASCAWSLELVETDGAVTGVARAGVLVGVNTALANRLAVEALAAGLVPGLARSRTLRREVRYGTPAARGSTC